MTRSHFVFSIQYDRLSAVCRSHLIEERLYLVTMLHAHAPDLERTEPLTEIEILERRQIGAPREGEFYDHWHLLGPVHVE